MSPFEFALALSLMFYAVCVARRRAAAQESACESPPSRRRRTRTESWRR